MRKRWNIVFLLLLSVSVLASCRQWSDDVDRSAQLWYYGNTPRQDIFDENYRIDYEFVTGEKPSAVRMRVFEKLDFAKDYDKIEVILGQERYPRDFETITATVTNHNLGKSFYVYDGMFIEKSVDGEWVHVTVGRETVISGWWLAGYDAYVDPTTHKPDPERELPDGYAVPNSIELVVDRWKIVEPGQYRAVVYVGKEVFYLPFEIYSLYDQTTAATSQ